MKFQDDTAEIDFAGRKLVFKKDGDGSLVLTDGGSLQKVAAEQTKKDRYYDLRILGLKTVRSQRMVQKTRTEFKTVPVRKSRTVTTHQSVYDPSSKSYKTRPVTKTEYYTDYQQQQVRVHYNEWTTVEEKVLDIPGYTVMITVSGNSFWKEAAVDNGDVWTFDPAADTLEKQSR